MPFCYQPVFLPSLGEDILEDTPEADNPHPLYDGLLADIRFQDLRRMLEGPDRHEDPIHIPAPQIGTDPNAPRHRAQTQTQTQTEDAESTAVLPAIRPDTAPPAQTAKPDTVPWLPDDSGATPFPHA